MARNRLLVSWSQCRLLEGTRIVPCTQDRLNATNPPPVEAPPLFGIYIYDVRDNTQRPDRRAAGRLHLY